MNPIELALILIVIADIVVITALVVLRVRDAGSTHRPDAAPIDVEPPAPQPSQATRDAISAPATAVVRREALTRVEDSIPDRAPEHEAATGTEDVESPDWRRVIRREAARTARYGRPFTVMQLEIDSMAAGQASNSDRDRAEGILTGLIAATIRSSDYSARTPSGQFHLLLSETHEAPVLWIAERIRSQFVRRAPSGQILLIGWAGAEPKEGPESSIRRAGERLHEDRRRMRAELAVASPVDQQSSNAAPPIPNVDAALSALEEVWKRGLISEEEYRAKRTEILKRL